ncbi:MAG: hypothetical protein QF544_06770 [Candidatus Thalassarchaeaceae archaeon]|nr:hypothetical protein [Candidatus Thalassarchaeaceae archaeon]
MLESMGGLESWKPWHSKQGGEGKGGSLTISASSATPIEWALAPSKSHMIRWLLLAAQGNKPVTLKFTGSPGEDVMSMVRCLRQLNVEIETGEQEWIVNGVGPKGFKRPISILHCGNSATTLRLLTIAAARLDCPVMLDGDRTLRKRHSETLLHILEYLGAEVSHGTGLEALPYLVHGPLKPGEVTIDVKRSSQPLSALLLSMPALDGPIRVNLAGDGVSRRHAQLSFELAHKTGSENEIDWRPHIILKPWVVECPEVVEIPSDRSLESFAMLYSTVHNVDINISNLPSNEDSLGAEILESLKSQEGPLDIDLRDANDLLPPLTAILALGSGGKISGATHARHKESNRIEKTVELLANFGIQAVASEDGISVEGGQTPVSPEDVVETHADHRLWMTAACLASKVGATLTHPNCFAVSDPDFLSRIV